MDFPNHSTRSNSPNYSANMEKLSLLTSIKMKTEPLKEMESSLLTPLIKPTSPKENYKTSKLETALSL